MAPTTTSNCSGDVSSGKAMIIFDWDDTILPSSYVENERATNVRELPQQEQHIFREIEKCAEECLATASKYGEVIIITNSDEGWVDYSAERYVPNLIPILKKYRVVSARTRYERFYPNQPLCWKAAAFAHEVNEHFSSLEEAHHMLDRECAIAKTSYGGVPDMEAASLDDSSLEDTSISSAEAESPGGWMKPSHAPSTSVSVTPAIRREIISFGDSIEERTAVKIVSEQLDALPKSVKFLGSPTPVQIIGQLVMLTHHMNFVCSHRDDLDLEISLKQAEKCAQGHLSRKGVSLQQEEERPSILQRIFRAGSSQMDSSCGDAPIEHDY